MPRYGCLLPVLMAGLLACTRDTSPDAAPLRIVDLAAPDMVLDTGFTYLSSVRELAGERLIITDPREGRIVMFDPATATLTPVGRQGYGPREWSRATALLPLAGDSSIQANPVDRRWVLFDGDRVSHVLPPDAPVIAATRGVARGADRFGRVLTLVSWNTADEEGDPTPQLDSLAAVLFDRGSGRGDTVAMLRSPPGEETRGRIRASSEPALAVGEEVALFVDGWLAVARLDPYRIDWRAPTGEWTLGAPLPVPVVPLDTREKEAYLARSRRTIARLDDMPPEVRDIFMRRFTEFPATIPPFQPLALHAGTDGRLYIRRTPTADAPEPRYDVIDRTHGLVHQLRLKPEERLVTATPRALHVVWPDPDGVERLRRYPQVDPQHHP